MPNLDPNIITPESVALYYSKARLLLDKVPGAAVAYSLHQLSSEYTSPVVRVREDDGDTEQDFTAKQITDGTLLDFCDGNSGFIVAWYDQSGNGRDATQTTTSDQPRIVNNGVLEDAVFWDGVNDVLNFSQLTFATDFTVIAAANGRENSFNDALLGIGNTTNFYAIRPLRINTVHQSLAVTNNTATQLDYAGGVTQGVTDVTIKRESGTVSGRYNGKIADATIANYTGDFIVNRIGQRTDTDFGAIDVRSLIVWPRALTLAELEKVEAAV